MTEENAMDSQPIRDERILEALEVCRGSGDLADPALAELADLLGSNPELKERYERLQRIDTKLAAAFHAVPVPDGLAQRIVGRLEVDRPDRAAQAAVDGVQESAEAPTPLSATEVPAPRPRRGSRRRFLAVAGALGTGAVLLVSALIYYGTRNPYDKAFVLLEAPDFFNKEPIQRGGSLLSNAPDDHPISREVQGFSGTRWRRISKFLGRKGVAYDLRGPGGASNATLYVVRLTVSGLNDTQPPGRPQRNTGKCCTAAWQEGKLLYVLVFRVPPGRRASDAYLDCLAPKGPVA